jgi:serine/threonine protein kinase
MHSIGLIHKDIKPQNIVYSKKSGHCVFIDFGLSHFVKEKPYQKSITYF